MRPEPHYQATCPGGSGIPSIKIKSVTIYVQYTKRQTGGFATCIRIRGLAPASFSCSSVPRPTSTVCKSEDGPWSDTNRMGYHNTSEVMLCARVPQQWARWLVRGSTLLLEHGDVQTMDHLHQVFGWTAVLPERCTTTTANGLGS